WSRAEVAKAVARRLPWGLGTGAEPGRGWIEATSAEVLAHPEVVTLASPLSAEVPADLRRRDGPPGWPRRCPASSCRTGGPAPSSRGRPDRRPAAHLPERRATGLRRRPGRSRQDQDAPRRP